MFVYFLMGDKIGVDLEEKVDGEQLGGVEKSETLIRNQFSIQ